MMSTNTKVKLVKNLDVTDLCGEKVMIDFNTGKYFLLQGAANDIWEFIKHEISIEEIKNKLLSIYDVDEKTCLDNIFSFIDQLVKYEFIALTE